jgi:hypothetical protein
MTADPLERIVYFSGPSGSGKTAMIQELMKRNPIYLLGHQQELSLAPRSDIILNEPANLHDEQKNYDLVKILIDSVFKETMFQIGTAMLSPDKIVLCKGSMYDIAAHISASTFFGTLTEEQENKLISYQNSLYEDCRPKNLIVINVVLNEVLKNLTHRWKTSLSSDEILYFRDLLGDYKSIFSILPVSCYLRPEDPVEVVDSIIRKNIKL